MKKALTILLCLTTVLCFSACNTSDTGVGVTTSSDTLAGETSLLSQESTGTSERVTSTTKTTSSKKTTTTAKRSSKTTKKSSTTQSSATKPLSSTATSGSKSTSTSPTTTTTTIDTAKNNNEQVKKVLQKVLTHEQNFTFKSLVFDKVTEENLEKFSFPSVDDWKNTFLPQAYMFIDFDSDNVEELLIIDMRVQFFLILRYENNAVFGYILENMDIQNIKTDGTFLTKIYKGYTAISNVSFDGLNCQVTHLAYQDEAENEYRLHEKPAEKEAVLTYFDDWDKNTTKLSWTML